MASAEARADGLRKAIEKMVVDVDKGHLRAMQKESYLAMARCCDTAAGPAELQQCCNQAEQKVRIAEQAVQAAMNEFNSKLQRCIQRCQDKAQDSLPVQPSEKDVAKAQEKLAACAADCAQEHEKQVPKLQAGIVHQMKQLR